MPVGCRALNFGPVTVSNAFLVVVPKAALAPLTAVMTPSLMGPSGMAGYFDAACVTGELDFDFDDDPQAASVNPPTVSTASAALPIPCFRKVHAPLNFPVRGEHCAPEPVPPRVRTDPRRRGPVVLVRPAEGEVNDAEGWRRSHLTAK